MIDIKEIRLGNYYLDSNGNVMKVDFIETLQEGFSAKIGQFTTPDHNEVDVITEWSTDAQPIEIDEKWLETLGFIKQGNRFYWLEIDAFTLGLYYDLHEDTIEVSVNVHTIKLDHIKYVHQLQNLYYALTNKEF